MSTPNLIFVIVSYTIITGIVFKFYRDNKTVDIADILISIVMWIFAPASIFLFGALAIHEVCTSGKVSEFFTKRRKNIFFKGDDK